MIEAAKFQAILFVDVTNSVKLYSEVGDARAHRMIIDCLAEMTTIIDGGGGTVVQSYGDGLMCRFPTADEAYQSSIAMRDSESNREVSLHMGFHYGSVIVEEDGVAGDTVNVAARMSNIAKAREIVTTEAAVANLSPPLRKNVRLVERMKVKGKQDPMNVYLVISEEEDRTEFAQVRVSKVESLSLLLIYQSREVRVDSKKPDVLIGRDGKCDLVVDHERVSRRHATVEFDRNKFFLVDHSSNGTLVRDTDNRVVTLRRDVLQLSGSGSISLGREFGDNVDNLVHFGPGVEN